MKKIIAVLLSVLLISTAFPITVPALTQGEAEAGYYIVGDMTGWKKDTAFRMDNDLIPGEDYSLDEYCLKGVRLSPSDSFKAAYIDENGSVTAWYPDGFENSYNANGGRITADGLYNIYLRPNFDGTDGWYFDCLYVECVSPAPTEDPTEDDCESRGGFYVVTERSGWRIFENNRLTRQSGEVWDIWDVTLTTSDKVKAVYSEDGKTVSAWYPSEDDEGYTPKYNSRFYHIELYPQASGVSDGDNECYKSFLRFTPCEPPQEEPTEQPAPPEEMKTNRFESEFFYEYKPEWEGRCTYEEIYYHPADSGVWDYDWVLIRTEAVEPVEGGYYGVFDDMLLYDTGWNPLDFGFGVYDVKDSEFYSITQAWDMGFDNLHDAFANLVRNRYNDAVQLGDADGDNELSIIDATYIQRYLADMIDLDECSDCFAYRSCGFGSEIDSTADYDASGEVDITDVTLIQRELVDIHYYPRAFTAGAWLEKDGDKVSVIAVSDFGDEPVEYEYAIDGGVHAYSVYGDDLGLFGYFNDPDYEMMPGDFHVSTGFISAASVELPVKSLTYRDRFTLTVTARDSRGRLSDPVKLYFKNVY